MKDTVVTFIPFGKKNTISREYLLTLCIAHGVIDGKRNADRRMRQMIFEARQGGTPIIYNRDKGGYFRPTKEDIAEMRAYIKAEESRAKAIFSSIKSAKKQLQDYEVGEDTQMAVDNYSIKPRVKNVPNYAWEKPVWVVRFCEDGNFWFYGAWDSKDMKKAAEVALEVSGIVISGE